MTFANGPFHSPAELNRLLSSNAQWAADVNTHEPEFFRQSAKGQAPKVGFAPQFPLGFLLSLACTRMFCLTMLTKERACTLCAKYILPSLLPTLLLVV